MTDSFDDLERELGAYRPRAVSETLRLRAAQPAQVRHRRLGPAAAAIAAGVMAVCALVWQWVRIERDMLASRPLTNSTELRPTDPIDNDDAKRRARPQLTERNEQSHDNDGWLLDRARPLVTALQPIDGPALETPDYYEAVVPPLDHLASRIDEDGFEVKVAALGLRRVKTFHRREASPM